MTPEAVQTTAAAIQAFLALVIAGTTLYFSRIANRLLKLQTEASIEPSVTLTIQPYVAAQDEPLNYIVINNHSPLELSSVNLNAEIFGQRASCPTQELPASRHLGTLPNLAPHSKQLWCIDEAVDESVELMKMGPSDTSPFKGILTAFIRLRLDYRRKSDGRAFQEQILLGLYKQPGLRPMAVYADHLVYLAPTQGRMVGRVTR